jgi:hypothetical protein
MAERATADDARLGALPGLLQQLDLAAPAAD